MLDACGDGVEARDRLAKAARLAGALGAVGLRGACGAPVEARGLGVVGTRERLVALVAGFVGEEALREGGGGRK